MKLRDSEKRWKIGPLLLFVCALVSTSCAKITVEDQPVYVDMGELGASVFHTLSDDRGRIAPADWPEKRFGMFCQESSDYADNVAVVLKACKLLRSRCKFEERQAIKLLAEKVLENMPLQLVPSQLQIEMKDFQP